MSEGFSYEYVCIQQPDASNHQPETHLQQTCRRRGDQSSGMTINIVPLKEAVTFKQSEGVVSSYDVPFVFHLWPPVLLRNLLPHPIAFKLKVRHAW